MTDKCDGCACRDDKIEELHELIGEAYQYIGTHCLDVEDVEKILDNLSEFKMIHTDVLPTGDDR